MLKNQKLKVKMTDKNVKMQPYYTTNVDESIKEGGCIGCHCEPSSFCHSEGARRPKNLWFFLRRFFAEFTLSGDSSTGSE
jgi:hypothetical protein